MTRRASSGTGYLLRHGGYRADIASVGASLRRLRWQGRDLVVPYDPEAVRPDYRGAVLAPWPNRVADGRWSWRGQAQQLPLTEPARRHALHGLVLWLDWQPRQVSPQSVSLTTTIWPQPGYPFRLELTVRWRLGADGLSCRLTAVNRGAAPAPYGCGLHPYLVAPTGTLDDWRVQLAARRRLEVDDRLVPVARATTPPPEHDLRTAPTVGGARIDHAYTDIAFDAAGQAEVTVTDASGAGTRIRFGRATPWVQICTADLPGEPGDRAGLAAEPMTCPPNALQTGRDLVVLEPGRRHVAAWLISAVTP